jgi:hypothetical protein
LALASVAAVLAGCQTPSQQNPRVLHALIGHDAAAVVQRLGRPSRAIDVGDHLFLAYDNRKGLFAPGFVEGLSSTMFFFHCDTTVELDRGVMKSFSIYPDSVRIRVVACSTARDGFW